MKRHWLKKTLARLAERLNAALSKYVSNWLALWISSKTGIPAPMPEVFYQELKRAILPIIAVAEDKRWHIAGTGFIVLASGKHALMMTAAHVFDVHRRLDDPNPRYSATALFFVDRRDITFRTTYMRAVYADPPRGVAVPFIDKVWTVDPLDIAVCALRIPNDSPLVFEARLAIDASPPILGERIALIGYGSMSVTHTDLPDPNSIRVDFGSKLEWREGRVVELFPGHGPRNEKTSSFRIDVPIDSGMSGGPVLRKSHADVVACGIAGKDDSNQKRPELGSGELALAWSMFQSLILRVDAQFEDGEPEALFLIDLIRRGLVDERGDAVNAAHIDFKPNNEGTTISWRAKR